MKTRYLFITLIVVLIVSCQKEGSDIGSDGDITISCAANLDDEGFTKGYVIDGSDTISGINKEGNKFLMDAWLEENNRAGSEKGVTDDKNPHYLNNKTFTNTGTQWTCSECTWRNDVFTNFWAVFPAMNTAILNLDIAKAVPTDAEQKTPVLAYDMSYLSVDKAATSDKDRACELSSDILVAYTRQKYKVNDSGSKSSLTLQFSHAASAIKFKKGDFTVGCDISYIVIKGIHLKGECVCTGDPNTKPQSVSFLWTPADTPEATDAYSLKQSISLDGLIQTEKGEKVLFTIPQELPSIATLSAYITKSGGTAPGLKTVNITGYSWKVGKEYTYTLSYDANADKLDVSIDDTYTNSTGKWTD